MKLAIPVDEKRLDSTICVSFGRAPYFMFYDTEAKTETYINNPGAASQGGAGIKAAQIIVDEKADALLTIRCGENAGELFEAAKISVFKTKGITAKENIEAYEKGELLPLTEFQRGFGGRW